MKKRAKSVGERIRSWTYGGSGDEGYLDDAGAIVIVLRELGKAIGTLHVQSDARGARRSWVAAGAETHRGSDRSAEPRGDGPDRRVHVCIPQFDRRIVGPVAHSRVGPAIVEDSQRRDGVGDTG